MSVQFLQAQGQKINVKGVIKDPLGETIIGANVQEKGISNGTITDINGNFSLMVSSKSTLVVSFIGYATQEIPVNGKTSFNITLKDDSKLLDEVVVVGYGTMRKKDLTGSIVQIRPDKFVDENPKTVQDILRGTAGLSVGYDPSAKGGGSMELRGQRSLYTAGGHNEPLIILDNMPFYGELSEINPDDIGQIDILKDASAAAIYGSKAATGVIIITTKKGKLGKPVVNFSANMGVTAKSAYREMFSPEGYMKYREDWYKKDSYGTNPHTGKYEEYGAGKWVKDDTQPDGKRWEFNVPAGYYDNPANLGKYGVTLDQWRGYALHADDESDASIFGRRIGLEGGVLENYLAGRTFDWYDHTFRTGFNQDYNVSISGASDKMNYYLSLGYMKNEGAVTYNDYETVRANLKLEGKINSWLEVGANVNFQDRSDGDLTPGLSTDYWDANQIRNSPYSVYRDANGNLEQYPMIDEARSLKRGFNYDFEREYLELEKGYTTLNSIFNVRVKLPFNITYSFNASPRYQWYYNRYFMSASKPESLAKDRGVDRGHAKRFDWSLNNTVTWEQSFAEKHRVSLTLVQEAEERRYWSDNINARNILPSDALGFHNTSNATKENSSFSTTDSHQTADALLARAFYSYDDRYMLTASIRRDGYSAFGQNQPYATFPSVALGWTFTNENFFNWEPMSTGKLRVSWGENGNRALEDPYVSLANLGAGAGATMGYILSNGSMEELKYLMVDRMANPYLQWEKTSSWNVGLDFGFLNDRISGSLEYYSMKTHDMIMWQRLPEFTGFGSIISNLGEVTNKGFEITLNTQNIKTRDFEWNTSLNFSYNQNKIKHIYNEIEHVLDENGNIISSKEIDDTGNNWFINRPISTIWSHRTNGIWQVNEAEEAAKYGQAPGDPKVVNSYTADDKVNADGTITPVYNDNDREHLGQTTPPINWQLRNDFTYKNWNLSFNIYSRMGHKSLSGNYLNHDNGGSLITYNFNTAEKEYWTPENPTNKYARLDAKVPTGANASKLYDRSFIRLENITVGYNIPKSILSKIDIEKVKLFGSIRNVAVWKKDWEYGDPETSGLATRIYSLGLNVTF